MVLSTPTRSQGLKSRPLAVVSVLTLAAVAFIGVIVIGTRKSAILQPYDAAFPLVPELKLTFDDGLVEIHPGAHLYVGERFLAAGPSVSWDHLSFASAPSLSYPGTIVSLFFIDFGPSYESGSNQQPFFPFVHALWTDCSYGKLSMCRALQEWRAPGNHEPIPNRYTFMLFTHDNPLVLPGAPGWLINFNLTKLGEDNPGMTLVASNHIRVYAEPPAPAQG